MKLRLFSTIALFCAVFLGCNRSNPVEITQPQEIVRSGPKPQSRARVGDYSIELWSDVASESFGPMMLIARDKTARSVDSCEGRFDSSTRPAFATDRYLVLVARSKTTNKRGQTLFVFDASVGQFRVFDGVTLYGCGIHENIAVAGNHAFLACCKSETPIGIVDLESGELSRLTGPQGAKFHLTDNRVFAVGYKGEQFEIVGEELVACERIDRDAVFAQNKFEDVFQQDRE